VLGYKIFGWRTRTSMPKHTSWPCPWKITSADTSGGSNANISINNERTVIKISVALLVVVLTACAGQPEQPYYPADMSGFVMNCRQAHNQIDFLSNQIAAYQAYHATHPVTLEDQRYYGKLKNNIWALRSTCDARYL